jgi:hypothetical protein
MNLHEMIFERWPAIVAIYEYGFLPAEDDIQEISTELYAVYEKQGGDISKKLYILVPKCENNQPQNSEVSLLTEDEIPKLIKAADFLRKYAKKAGCESENSDDVLAAAATILPPVFTRKSRFAQSE